MKQALFTLIFLLTAVFNAAAQQTNFPLQFQEKSFDIGEIGEESGIVYHVFSFVNTGSDTVLIESAKAKCHCTKGEFPLEAIPPKGSGKIRVQYDPKGRPWPIDAEVDLKLRGKAETNKIKLSGLVTVGRKTARFSPAEYTRKFDFNEKLIDSGEKEFRQFVEKMLPLLERHGDVKIQIESSASNVPTKSYSSNEELTIARAAEARAEILEILNAGGAKPERVIFQPDISKVQGPEFTPDYKKQMARYTPFQYVKVRVY